MKIGGQKKKPIGKKNKRDGHRGNCRQRAPRQGTKTDRQAVKDPAGGISLRKRKPLQSHFGVWGDLEL